MNLLVALMSWTSTFLSSARKRPRRDSSPPLLSAGIVVQEAFDRIPTTLTGSTHIQRACVAAAQIYWTSIKLSVPLNAPINYQKVIQIKRALIAATPDTWNGGSEIRFWVLLVAVAATRHRSEKCWFLAYLVPLGLRLGTLEYHRTMDMISGFMAVEDYLNTPASLAGSTAGDVEAFEKLIMEPRGVRSVAR